MMHCKPMVVIGVVALWAFAANAQYATNPCQPPVAYTPDPTVEYQPGVDAQGWSLVPADTEPQPLSAEHFGDTKLELDVPLSSHLDTSSYQADLSESKLHVGTITLGEQEPKLNQGYLTPEAPPTDPCQAENSIKNQ